MKTFTLAELERMLEIAPGKRVQFHPQYCQEAVGTDRRNFDTSHDLSVIRPDGTRVKLAQYKHASEAALSQEAPDLVTALHAALVREQEHDAEAAKLREALEAQRRILMPVFMTLAYEEMAGQPVPDDSVILSFMGGGGSDNVTAGMFREADALVDAALSQIEAPKGD